ncbi:MAG: diaminopimelate decarboxylase [Lentisphaeria bacterium]|nr:diaminopimelate decarboxylase [Lentisphaeria bacterium]
MISQAPEFPVFPLSVIPVVAELVGTPAYLYDEAVIIEKCRNILAMPNAYGLEPRFAMKANSSRALLRIIAGQGINIDASSVNEALRARAAGIPADRIMLTTQEVPYGEQRENLERLMLEGMRYNVCSPRQLEKIADFAAAHDFPLSMRVHPGVGSGESATRNTGDKYSCFGVHLSDLEAALAFGREKGLIFDQVHTHIGSGGDPAVWRDNIDRELGFVETFFPDAVRVSFGGGFCVARVPGEKAADVQALGEYAKQRFEDFKQRTGRELIMEVEPGTYIVANAGYAVTRVIDLKKTGDDGFDFIVIDGGMEVNTRPLLYGSQHPLFVVSADGDMLSSDLDATAGSAEVFPQVVVGRCCESGDSQTLDGDGHICPRPLAKPVPGDFLVIGGCGAYCAAMSPFNYNSHAQAPETLLRTDGSLEIIRNPQPLEQIWQNEIG